MKIIAVDIGGTTIKSALFIDDKLVDSFATLTRGNTNRETILEGVFQVIDKFYSLDIAAIGVSSAGNINPKEGKCVYATDNLMGWTGLNLKKIISDKYGTQVFVDNDAVCSLYGELLNYPGLTDAVMLTLGTGVGGAAIIDNNVIYGKNYTGARFGHMIIEHNGRPCNCGNKGCLEQYISATAIIDEAKKYDSNIQTAKEVFDLYRKGDSNMIKVVNDFMNYLNTAIQSINSIFAPQLIIIGGGVSLSSDIIFKLLDSKINNVSFSQYKDKSALYGAFKIAEEGIRKEEIA